MDSIRTAVHTASDLLDAVTRVATIITTVAFTLLVFVSVLTRYVFEHPILFAQEVSKLLFVWSAFLAATIAFRRKAHIRFEFLNHRFGRRGLLATDLLLYVFSIVLFAIVFVHGIRFTRIVWPTILPVLTVSQGWLYVPVVVTAVIFIVHSLRLGLDTIAEFRSSASGGAE